MKISKPNNKKKIFLLTLLVAVLILGGIAAAYVSQNNSASTETTQVPASTNESTQVNDGEDSEEPATELVEDSDSLPTKEDRPQPSSPPENATLDTSITALEVNENILYVRNEVSGLYNSGTCTLKLKKDSQTVTKTSGVQALAQISTCKGFNIPTSELSAGTWSVELIVKINSKQGSDTKKITI